MQVFALFKALFRNFLPDKLVLDVEKKLDFLFLKFKSLKREKAAGIEILLNFLKPPLTLVLKDKRYHFSVKGPKNEEETRTGRISQEY